MNICNKIISVNIKYTITILCINKPVQSFKKAICFRTLSVYYLLCMAVDMGLAIEDSHIVYFDSKIANSLGINIAIILNRINWSINKHSSANDVTFFKEGQWWMYDSVTNLVDFTTLGRDAVKRSLKKLRELNILQIKQFDLSAGIANNWYSINSQELNKILATPLVQNQPVGGVQNQPVGGCKTNQCIGAKPTNLSKSLSKSLTKREHDDLSDQPPLSQNKKIKVPKLKIIKHTEEDLEIAKLWLEFGKQQMTWGSAPSSWSDINFAESIYEIRAKTNLTHSDVKAMLNYIRGDPFWCKNGLSPVGMLKKSKNNDLRKIDNIQIAMKKGGLKNASGYHGIDISATNWSKVDDSRPW